MKINNLLYLLILISTLSGFTNQKKELRITYIANCGFLYEGEKSKVLIDPFGTKYENIFYLPSDSTKANIIKGKAPFDDINLLLITHIHEDHFNLKLAEEFLLKHPNTKMVCPTQVYSQMKDSCIHFSHIVHQLCSPKLAIGELKSIKINDITVTVLRMQHGTNRNLEGVSYKDYSDYEKTENFGYHIQLDKKNIFHQGDGALKMNKKALTSINKTIDIAYLSYFDWDSTSFNILKKDLKTNKVIFMHGTKPAKELDSERFKQIVPQLIIYNKELEYRNFDW